MFVIDSSNIGFIQEKEYGNEFTYKKTDDVWANSHDLFWQIDVLDGVRYATIKRTVAYVCVGEDYLGFPILEKWELKKNKVYPMPLLD